MTQINDFALSLFARMQNVKSRAEEGAAMTEYGLLLALIAVVAVGALTTLGGNVRDIFNSIAGNLAAGG